MYQTQYKTAIFFKLQQNQKLLAWFLFGVFYLSFVGQARAFNYDYISSRNYNNNYGNYSNDILERNAFKALTSSNELTSVKSKRTALPLTIESKIKTELPILLNAEQEQFEAGPGQPEMSSFKSIGVDNMVSPFTGDFSYNIPLLDVGGYPVNIFYNAGATMEQESSWVGLGWNLNPGTINRAMRGLPDDFNGEDKIQKEVSIGEDLTVSVTASKDNEIFGKHITLPKGFGISSNYGIKWNNKRGVGLSLGMSGSYTYHGLFKNLANENADTKTQKDTTTPPGFYLKASAGLNLSSADGFTANLGFSGATEKVLRIAKSGNESTASESNSKDDMNQNKVPKENYVYAELFNFSPTFSQPSYTPSIIMPTTNYSGLLMVKLGSVKKGFMKDIALEGSLSRSYIQNRDKFSEKSAYGFMYFDKGQQDENGLMDFNRANDRNYHVKSPTISVPVYTYDVFSISGEGTGGSFRGYRGSVGFVKDPSAATKSINGKIDLNFAKDKKLQVGTSFGGTYSKTTVNGWNTNNALQNNLSFTPNKENYEGFYFKNPAEMAIIDNDFYDNIGKDKLVRPVFLTEAKTNGAAKIYSQTPILESQFQVFGDNLNPLSLPNTYIAISKQLQKKVRDKRSQIISFLTAEEAQKVALDKKIRIYKENTFVAGSCATGLPMVDRFDQGMGLNSFRKRHHISEITVLENDSKRYIYGLPVYTKFQKEVSFSVDGNTIPNSNQTIVYKPATNASGAIDGGRLNTPVFIEADNWVDNKIGKERFFESQKTSNYAHGFMLTAILSPDYVDVSGNGITDDDLGTAVKFNYSSPTDPSNSSSENDFKWRYPISINQMAPVASFNNGLKTDKSDNKASYTFGAKELYYVHSIESKNMIATFTVSKRNDGMQVLSENGGIGTINDVAQRKLDKIDLYTKADFVKNFQTGKAKPIKTIHFEYDYSLCGNYDLNSGQSEINSNGININIARGKLTLKRIYFTYNGNKRKSGEYNFKYADKNPNYNTAESDRWGNYKSFKDNPNSIQNIDYTYATQNPIKADENAAAWNLQKILLPSGALLNVDYESDTYAFVQDKRAAIATKIVGFAESPNGAPSDELYKKTGLDKKDNRYIFFESNQANLTKQEIKERFLVGLKQLLLKLWVKVPSDLNGSGFEPIHVYSTITDDYGPVPNNPNQFYMELQPISVTLSGIGLPKDGSQSVQTVLNFARTNLQSKVYPGYDNSGATALGQVVRAVYGLADRIAIAAVGFEAKMKLANQFANVDLVKSFARLNTPNAIKYGGGHRVKKITIYDNWNKISKIGPNEVEKESTYGQEFFYDKSETISNNVTTISSGVATYEPGVGAEENPFREIIEFSTKQSLAPTRYENQELPIAETFFPNPSVGYSVVTIKSIHRNKPEQNVKIKSAVGKQVKEFYTCRDFPLSADFTPFDNESRKTFKPSPILKAVQLKKKDLLSLTQGFRVVLNDMHGKQKAEFSYSDGDEKTIINSTKYTYRTITTGNNKYKLDNVVKVLNGPNNDIEEKIIGKEVELMNDSREHYTFTNSSQIPADINFFTVGNLPVLIPTIFKAYFRDENLFRSFTTLKVVTEFGIIEKVENNDKGSIISTENLVYDAETGGVLISKTKNEFKKEIYNVNYPAHWVENGMAPAYKNIDLSYNNVTFRNGKLEGVTDMGHFESGDELYVTNSKQATISAPDCTGNGTCATLNTSVENKIWALDVRKDPTKNQITAEFIFIDRNGNPFTAVDVNIKVIRSGRRNLNRTMVGSIVCMENPISIGKLVVDDATKVLNASAMRLKEKWRGQDMFYTTTQVQTITREVPLVKRIYRAVEATSISQTISPRSSFTPVINNSTFFRARYYNYNAYPFGIQNGRHKSWIKFDLSDIQEVQNVYSAKLSLASHGFASNNNQSHSIFNFIHSPNQPHLNQAYTNNSFIVRRMSSLWPANNSVAWQHIVNLNVPLTALGSNITYPKTLPIFSNVSYLGQNAKDATAMVRGMIRDRNSKQYATGVSIELLTSETGPNRDICFESGLANSQSETFLEVDVVDCSQTWTSGPKGLCTTQEAVTTCHSAFSKNFMNPYIQGILGNYRAWRSYVFYGERKDAVLIPKTLNQPDQNKTDVANMGTLKDFVPYWVVSNNKIIPTTSSKWVWNSHVTQYNRKGAELEDQDALGRYNGALYGYQETLPIATVNNSRLRQAAFDGFEDYEYKDDPCEPYCKPAKVHFKTGITFSNLEQNVAHTGKYSYKLNGSQTLSIPIPVSANNEVREANIEINLNKTGYTQTTVVSNGMGLTATYYDGKCWWDNNPANLTFVSPNINFWANSSSNTGSLPFMYAGSNRKDVSSFFRGSLQVPKSGRYIFYIHQNEMIDFKLSFQGTQKFRYVMADNGTIASCWTTNRPGIERGENKRFELDLIAGNIYEIEIFHANKGDKNIALQFKWIKPCLRDKLDIEDVPNIYLYPVGTTPPTPQTIPSYCYNPQKIQATANATIDGFELIPTTSDKKMIGSIWVKKAGQDCKCNNYTGINITVKNGAATLGTLLPKSKIIEGWQLFEGEFDVPNITGNITFEATAVDGSVFNLDDLRFHPFNANMKSFVFDPVNLRLTSELDENNYASFYEYDNEGTLVRTKKETIKGIKTITETRSALQNQIKQIQ
jgi:hypothetical protein